MDVQALLAQREKSPKPSAATCPETLIRPTSPRSPEPSPRRPEAAPIPPRPQQPPRARQQSAAPQPTMGVKQPSMPQPYQPQGRSRGPMNPAPIQEAPPRKGPRLGSVIFYTIYFLGIFLFSVGCYKVLGGLHGWLVDFEAAQPTLMAQQVFDSYFANPDWGALYDLSGVTETSYEGKTAFVAYIEEKVGGRELTYYETSAGLSEDKKYIVALDGEKLATFTLTGGKDPEINLEKILQDPEASLNEMSDVRQWELGSVQLFTTYSLSYRIQTENGHTVYVNGVPLTERNVIQIASVTAEDYLPMGVAGPRTYVHQVDGLMKQPEVTITDASGQNVPVVFDAEKNLFIAQTEDNTIGDEEYEVTVAAAQEFGLYMIKKSSAQKVAKYFDSNSEAYKAVIRSEVGWTQKNKGAEFVDVKVTDYCRYNQELFSARASMTVEVTRTDGTIKEFYIDTTLFFKWTGTKWIAFDMTNEDVQKAVGQVRLTFMDGDTELTSGFVATDAQVIKPPVITPPEGKTFVGWFTRNVDKNGRITMNLVFTVNENGEITPGNGVTLEPMVLYAVFE